MTKLQDYDGYHRTLGMTARGAMPWWDFDGPDAFCNVQAALDYIAEDGMAMGFACCREESAHLIGVGPPGEAMSWKHHTIAAAEWGADVICSGVWQRRDASTLRLTKRDGEVCAWLSRLGSDHPAGYNLRELAHAIVYAKSWGAPPQLVRALHASADDRDELVSALLEVDFIEYQTAPKPRPVA